MRGIERLAHVLRGEKWAYLCHQSGFADSAPRRAVMTLKTRFLRAQFIVTTFFLRETLRAV